MYDLCMILYAPLYDPFTILYDACTIPALTTPMRTHARMPKCDLLLQHSRPLPTSRTYYGVRPSGSFYHHHIY